MKRTIMTKVGWILFLIFSISHPFFSQLKNEIYLIQDKHLIIANPVDPIFIENDCFYQENGHYSVFSSVNESILPSSILEFKNKAFYTYDINLSVGKAQSSGLYSMHCLIPHWSDYETWKELNNDPDSICTSLKRYASDDNYFCSPIISSQTSPLFGSEAKLNLIKPEIVDSSLFIPLFYNWLAQQDSTKQFQNRFKLYEKGAWWKNKHTSLNLKIFRQGDNQYFGYAGVYFDGSELEQKYPDKLGPYFGFGLNYLFIIDGNTIHGMELIPDFFIKSFTTTFIEEDSQLPFILLSCVGSGSNFLYYYIDNEWALFSSHLIGYYDCPY